MTNDDLKRFYNVNDKPEQNKDFVRYGSNGEIISEHDATKDEEVVNYRTLMQHASGGSGGSKVFGHYINSSSASLVLYTTNADVIDTIKLKEILTNFGCIDQRHILPCQDQETGFSSGANIYISTGLFVLNNTIYILKLAISANTGTETTTITMSRSSSKSVLGTNFTDTVIEL